MELREKLAIVWPDVQRAPLMGIYDAGDFVNTPFPIEAKSTKTMLVPAWVKVLRAKAARAGDGLRWMLAWKGDRRREDGQPLVIMPLNFAIELLHYAYGPFGALARGPVPPLNDVLDKPVYEGDAAGSTDAATQRGAVNRFYGYPAGEADSEPEPEPSPEVEAAAVASVFGVPIPAEFRRFCGLP